VPSVNGLNEWPSNIGGVKTIDGLKFVTIDVDGNGSKCSTICDNEVKELWESCIFWTRFNDKYGFNIIRGIPND
jgi:hypothetical protein